MRAPTWSADRLLTLAAVLGAAVIVLTILGPVVGVRPMVVTSGSMTPTFDTGALALTHRVPAGAVRVGDVVAVTQTSGAWGASGTRVMHRVVARTSAGLVLRGDANNAPDPQPYDVDVVDRTWATIPIVGFVIAGLSGPAGLLALTGALLGLVLLTRQRPS